MFEPIKTANGSKIVIRPATSQDMYAVRELIMELAIYEKAPQEVSITVQQLIEDGFGNKPKFGCKVAEENSSVVGFVLFFECYSTWKGNSLFLEDFIDY